VLLEAARSRELADPPAASTPVDETRRPLPTFIESTFSSKVEYEAWIKTQQEQQR
jgi:hypothetical protein